MVVGIGRDVWELAALDWDLDLDWSVPLDRTVTFGQVVGSDRAHVVVEVGVVAGPAEGAG